MGACWTGHRGIHSHCTTEAPIHGPLLLVDYMFDYPQLLLTTDIRSSAIICWLQKLFAWYGCPGELASDNSQQGYSPIALPLQDSPIMSHWGHDVGQWSTCAEEMFALQRATMRDQGPGSLHVPALRWTAMERVIDELLL